MIKNKLIDDIIKIYPDNGLYKTANLIGISVYSLKKILYDNNIILKKNRRVDYCHFESINKKEVAYFLGFFWADGYISKNEITITIKNTDADDILNVLNKFGSWRINNINKKLNNKIFEQVCIRINDKDIKKFLISNDYNLKSTTSPDKIFSLIPENIKKYFIRGLIDGDGCFCSKNRNYFSITSSINQDWNLIESIFIKLGVKYKITKKKRKCGSSSYIVLSSKSDIIKLGDYIYGENYDNIGLKRKYTIYLEIKNKPVSKYSRFK